jgi:hypothetical protein
MLEAKENAAKPQLADLIRPNLFHHPIASQASEAPDPRRQATTVHSRLSHLKCSICLQVAHA